jgi:hypothetical protein
MVVLPPQGPPAIVVTGLTRRPRSRIVVIMNIRLWIIVWLCLLSHTTRLWSTDDSVAEKRRYLAAGMRAQRESLRSGHVVMLGEHTRQSADFSDFRVPVRFRYYFDHDALTYRHETRDYTAIKTEVVKKNKLSVPENHQRLPHGVTDKGVEWMSREVGGIVVNTPECSLFKSHGTKHVDRLPPGTVGHTHVREMDVRVFGMVDWMLFDTGTSCEKCLDAFQRVYPGAAVDAAGNGVVHFTFTFKGDAELEFWIDEKHGMTPLRMIRSERISGQRVQTSRSEVSWEARNGTWVPKTFLIQSNHQSGSKEELALTLDWESVNEPLAPKVFTAAGLAETHKEVRLVADMTLGTPIIEPVVPREMKMDQPLATSTSNQPPFRLGWILLAQLITGVGFAWWYSCRKSRRQSA